MNRLFTAAVALAALGTPLISPASSHREAPTIAGLPRLDGTDLYMFRSYEPGRQNYVTFIANYIPLQDPGGGPNFYTLDPNAVYAINIDNTGEAVANMQFLFYFSNTEKHIAVDAGNKSVQIPLLNSGPVNPQGQNLNVQESYKLYVRRNDGTPQQVVNYTTGTDRLLQAGRQHRQQVDSGLRRLRPGLCLYHLHTGLHRHRARVCRTAQGRLRRQPRRDL